MNVFFAMIVQNRLQEIQSYLPFVLEHLQPNQMVIVDGGSTDGTFEFLTSLQNTTVLRRPFIGDFVSQRNTYLHYLESYARDGDLLLVSDADEYLSVDLLHDVRQLAEQAYAHDVNLIRIRAWDELYDRNNNVISSFLNNWWKPLVALWEPGGGYVGAGGRPIHEELHFPSGRRFLDLDDQGGKYYYRHRKQYGVIWPRALRNFYISGIGPDGQYVPYWKEFIEMLQRYGMNNWPEVEQRFIQGHLAFEIRQWLAEHRKDPYAEVRDSFLAYFVWWNHFEELPVWMQEEYQEEYNKIHEPLHRSVPTL